MAKFNSIKPGFLAGEVSPKALGRVDMPQYGFACEELRNMIALIEGGAMRRPGSQYVKNTQGDVAARLIPFIFSKTEAYVFEITTTTIRAISVSDRSVATVTMPFNYSSGELNEIQFTQSADVLYLVHQNHIPYTISRVAPGVFITVAFGAGPELTKFWVKRWPFLDPNITATTLQPSATTGVITVTASVANTIQAGHVGAIFKLTHAGVTGAVQITGITDAFHAVGSVINTFGATGATSNWEESAWSDLRGWPRTIAFFENRLFYGGTPFKPDTLWASKAFNYTHLMARKFEQDGAADVSGINYFGTTVATDPLAFAVASQQVNAIQWLSPGKTLAVGTLGAEYVGSDISATSAPTFDPESTHGSSFVAAKRAGTTVLYTTRSGKRISELQFEFTQNSFVSKNLSRFAKHGRIVQMDYQDERQILWCVDADGNLFGMTRDKDQEMTAFHYHELGGTGVDMLLGTPRVGGGSVLSLCVVPNEDGTHDDVWLCVTRVVNGAQIYTIEVIGREYEHASLDDYPAFLPTIFNAPVWADCASWHDHSGSPVTSITGLNRFKGETVDILANGFALTPAQVTTGGVLTIPSSERIVVGFPYSWKIKPVRPDAGAVLGSSQGATKRIDRVVIRFYRTVGCLVGPTYGIFEEMNFRPTGLPVNQPIPLYSGDKKVSFQGGHDMDGYVCLQGSQPYPATVLAIMAKGETNEA
jgi:hypothetical protein